MARGGRRWSLVSIGSSRHRMTLPSRASSGSPICLANPPRQSLLPFLGRDQEPRLHRRAGSARPGAGGSTGGAGRPADGGAIGSEVAVDVSQRQPSNGSAACGWRGERHDRAAPPPYHVGEGGGFDEDPDPILHPGGQSAGIFTLRRSLASRGLGRFPSAWHRSCGPSKYGRKRDDRQDVARSQKILTSVTIP